MATFNSKGFSGIQKKRITVRSNDPKNPATILNMRGFVIVDLTVSPKKIYIDLKKNETLVIIKFSTDTVTLAQKQAQFLKSFIIEFNAFIREFNISKSLLNKNKTRLTRIYYIAMKRAQKKFLQKLPVF